MSSTDPAQKQAQQQPQAARGHHTAAAPAAAAAAAAAADDDQDDLDDLDDVLDEFNKPQPSTSATAGPPKSQPPPPPSDANPSSSSATAPLAAQGETDELDADGLDDILSQDFAKELAQGMEALMKELGQANPSASGAAKAGSASATGAQDPQFSEEELMKQFEQMMAGFSQPSAAPPSAPAAAGPSSSTAQQTGTQQPPANFNDALKATMDRLKQSDASATASSSSAGADPFAALGGAGGDDMAKLLAALGAGAGGDGDDGMDNPELAKMLEGMMDELMSKEILYEPLKELRDKYPAYLDGPDSKGDSPDDRARYQAQQRYVGEIVAIFEDPKYDAKNRDTTARIQDLMNQMQDCGSPPQQIVGEMPAELENIPGFGGDNGECTIM
ncbi:uncharacterized protein PFL1_04878 [Pseudozyma flocculosa PF-1]|uniref:Related to PEX19 - required for biogenesis of peroxisomes (Peroxin) n=2 Tax=Pseudozyma flocculosa TaxID=84751 RepID=A0A5C3F3V9_9BASI|nr:uncharacterized protein PFL1_04878 [Pseudozyma flocculosa PF-1]EPQ27741.1 hypothetical protein PFL1_04878 [Pseudozyma flocculosa PF-1]SPO39118.1 related to PEX19 - required for biogenesis of peroxisomes (peroxin) [Pseudozyma flocculosa]